jgi:hypothetical protein
MSLSEKAAANKISLARSHQATVGVVFPLLLVCVALAIILASAISYPVALDPPGAESLLIGP